MKRSVFVIIFMILFLTGCRSNKPASQCPLEQLVLDQTSLPAITIVDPIYSPISISTDSATRTFIIGKDNGMQAIARWTYARTAKNYYNQVRKSFYKGNDWSKAQNLYFNDHADRYYVACGTVYSSYRCIMIAQYNQYFTLLSTTISDEGITREVFLNLAKKIDSQITSCIDN